MPEGYNEENPNGIEKEWAKKLFDKNGKLRPNVQYYSGEFNYHYETDDLGRICHWDTNNLQHTERENRLSYHYRNPPGKIPIIDEAGHLAGDQFGGSNRKDNIVAQAFLVNRSGYRKLENEWADALAEQKHVAVDVNVIYEGDSMRPDAFAVEYWIDGVYRSDRIPNY